MSRAATELRIFKLPVYKNHNTMTVAEKNQNLEYMVSLLEDATGMELISSLTNVDTTWGNAYFLGYDGETHAALCVYMPHRSITTNRIFFCFTFVDPLNLAMDYSSGTVEYYGYSTNEYVFVLDNGRNLDSTNETYWWGMVTTISEEGVFIHGIIQTTTNLEAQAYAQCRSLYNSTYNALMYISKNNAIRPYFKGYNNNCFAIDSPIQKNAIVMARIGCTEITRAYLDLTKKYYSRINIFTSDNQNVYQLDEKIKSFFMINITSSIVFPVTFWGGICKIDDKYHLIILAYSDTRVGIEIGDEYEMVEIPAYSIS